MPHLLNFISSNGTLLTNDHTVLISHTATGILSSLTGVYPDRMGQPVSNSFRYFNPSGTSRTGVAFAYWTAPIFDPAGPPFPPAGQTDLTPEMINENGKIAPAPWVPYTRAGCDFGAVATANTILENTGRSTSRRCSVPARRRPPRSQRTRPRPSPTSSASASTARRAPRSARRPPTGRPTCCPTSRAATPASTGLFGAKYVDPAIGFSTPTDLNGNTIQDATGHVGFPGFDGMEATVSLSWVAQMQEAGVPVTYAYISDAHDGHGTSGNIHFAYGPGEAGYRQQLKRLRQGVREVLRPPRRRRDQEEQHALRLHRRRGRPLRRRSRRRPPAATASRPRAPTPASARSTANLRRMIRTQFGDTTAFTVHSDDAPNVYVNGNPAGPTPAVRQAGARDGPAELEEPVHRRSSPGSWWRWPTRSRRRRCTWSRRIRSGRRRSRRSPIRTGSSSPRADLPRRAQLLRVRAHPGPDLAELRLEPRRHPGRDRLDLGRLRRAGRRSPTAIDATWTDHTDVRPTMLSLLGLKDDLCPRRSGAHRPARRLGGAAVAQGPPGDAPSSW